MCLIWPQGFHFPKCKTNQLGKRSDVLCHVHPNPGSPQTCAQLALTQYMFSNPGILERQSALTEEVGAENVEGLGMTSGITINGHIKFFPGMNQHNQFMKKAHKVSLTFYFLDCLIIV